MPPRTKTAELELINPTTGITLRLRYLRFEDGRACFAVPPETEFEYTEARVHLPDFPPVDIRCSGTIGRTVTEVGIAFL